MKKLNILIMAALSLILIICVYALKQYNENSRLNKMLALQIDTTSFYRKRADTLVTKLSIREQEFAKNLAECNDVRSKMQLELAKKSPDAATKQLIAQSNDVSAATYKLNNLPFQFEMIGFKALTDDNFNLALKSFTDAEAASPSFHMAYEISRLLKSQQRNFGNKEIEKDIKKQIIKNYSWRAPKDLLDELKKQASN